jgi:signal peptidase
MRRAIDVVLVVAVLVALALAAGPRFFHYHVFDVLSGSMSPAIPIGTAVVDGEVRADQLATGDVLTFPEPGRPGVYITHRIVAIDQNGAAVQVATKGDANGARDPWALPYAPGATALRVVFAVPLAGYVLGFLGMPLGRVLLVAAVVLAAALFLADLWGVRRPS